MANLVIVESPAKAKTIGRFLGKDFRLSASFGHIRDLPAHKFGVDIKDNFEPTYAVPPDKKKIAHQLILAAKNSKEIYLATDEDREGEAIAWHIAILLKRPLEEVKRVVFHEITKNAIQEAFNHPRKINLSLVKAQQARRILDRLVGYQLSPFLSEKMRRRGLSAGRVQSVSLRMIVEREKEIEAFKPQEYWTVKANLDPHLSPPPLRGRTEERGDSSFSAILFSIEGKKIPKLGIKNKEEAEKITSDLKDASFIVEKVKKEEKKRYPFPPFTTSTLQQEASYKLRFSAKKTMRTAQFLYEGIQLEKGQVGLITYMRTDSLSISKIAQGETLSYIKNKFGDDYIPNRPNIYKTKAKGAQEAHEAIRPTSVLRTPGDVKEFLTPEQEKLYTLIWNRFVASQMTPAIFDTVSVEIKAKQYLFSAKGETLKFLGYKKVYSSAKKEKETVLPPLAEKEKLICSKLIPEQHFTKPPDRYSEATLIKTMEKYGIGRPSTYAPTISTILARKYVELEKRLFKPLPLGITVNEVLIKYFSGLINVDFTAAMEGNLDEIADGKQEWLKVLKNFYQPFSEKLKVANAESGPPQNFGRREKPQETGEKCPKCGAVLLIREGRYGKFLGCSGFPKCKYTRPLTPKKVVQETGEKCPKCGAVLLIREGRYGKFLGCSGFPKCKYIKKIEKK